MSIGISPEVLSQQILAEIILVGRLGVPVCLPWVPGEASLCMELVRPLSTHSREEGRSRYHLLYQYHYHCHYHYHLFRAAQVRAYEDRAHSSFVSDSYVSTLCPAVLCPDLCTSEQSSRFVVMTTVSGNGKTHSREVGGTKQQQETKHCSR